MSEHSNISLSCHSNITVGKITLPSTILQFWDLGGQRGIRNIWHRYYDDCHAVVFVLDAEDRERLSEGWEVFGTFPFCEMGSISIQDTCSEGTGLTFGKDRYRFRTHLTPNSGCSLTLTRKQAGQPK